MIHYVRINLGLIGFIAGALLSAHADTLDDTIVALMQKRNIPGLSLAVVQDGKIVKAQGYGVVEAGGTTPVTPDTLFQAASISKPVSALGALRLVEAKKLSLDADINTLLKSWKVPENEFTATEKVTLRRLLSHTAGLTVSGFLGYAADAARPTLLQILAGEKPANNPAVVVDFQPGSRFRYAGGGYVVLQQLVIDVTGQSYPEFMRETVLKPIGMLSSSFEQPLPESLAAKIAAAHLEGKPVAGRSFIQPELAPAGLWTTPSDLARFAIAIQEAIAGKPGAILSPATAQLMVTPVMSKYGLGLMLDGDRATGRFAHNGRNRGFDSLLVASRGVGQAAAVMINTNDTGFIARVMAAIVQQYGWQDYQPYGRPPAIEDKEPEITAQLRKIMEQLPQGTFERGLFTEKLAEIFDGYFHRPDELRRVQGYGALQSITLVGKRANGTDRDYRYYVLFENETLIVTCTYNADGKISALSTRPE